jgi:hypothetical protein
VVRAAGRGRLGQPVARGRCVDAGAGTPTAVSAAQGQTVAAQRASGVAARRVGWRGRGRWLGEQRRRRQNKKWMRCEVLCGAWGERIKRAGTKF